MNLQELAHLLTSQNLWGLPCSYPAHNDKTRQMGQEGIPVAYGHWLVARDLRRIHISPLLLLWKVGDIQAQKGAFGKPESVHSLIKGAVMALSECGKECQLHRGADPHRTCQGVHRFHT